MFQLIIVVLAIALTAALVMVTVKYLPWWTLNANRVEDATRTSLLRLDQAYDVAARAANGVPPSVTADPDGGFVLNFRPVMRLLPAAPQNTVWVYGQHPVDATPYSGMHYFCLKTTTGGGGDEALWRGVNRARGTFSSDQAYLNSACGAISSVSLPTTFPAPLALTFFVAYVPGIDK